MPHRRRHLLAVACATAASTGAALPARLAAAQGQQRFANMVMFIPAGPGGGWDGLGRASSRWRAPPGWSATSSSRMSAAPAAWWACRASSPSAAAGGGLIGRRIGDGRRGVTNRSPVTIKDVVPIARMTEEVGVVVVPAIRVPRHRGQLAALRANPGAGGVGGGSAGGTDHITLGLILKALGRNPREASYVAFAGGGPAQAAILGGQVKAGISGYSEFSEQIKAGRMRALATTGGNRSGPTCRP